MTTYYTYVDSPIGTTLLGSDGAALTALYMNVQKKSFAPPPDWVENGKAAPLPEAKAQLEAYFRGERKQFELPLLPQGTDFQMQVWAELRRIPYGETISYGELARRIGDPNASRAVGLANGRNPIGIVIPCHRVIGADGKLTGFGGGIENKAILLDLERGAGGGTSAQLTADFGEPSLATA